MCMNSNQNNPYTNKNMKTLLNKLTLIAALVLAINTAQAQSSASVSPSAAARNTMITNASRILSVTIANASAATLGVTLFDAGYNSTTNLTWTNSAYTNTITYTTNIVTSYVTTTGVTNSLTNSGIFTVINTVSAATNSFPTVNTLSAPAGETVVWVPTGGYIVSRGLIATNNTNCTITVQYVPAF